MTKFPVDDAGAQGALLNEIGDVIEKHLGVWPTNFVLIMTDGKNCQTIFAGSDQRNMTKLLTEAAENHVRTRSWAN